MVETRDVMPLVAGGDAGAPLIKLHGRCVVTIACASRDAVDTIDVARLAAATEQWLERDWSDLLIAYYALRQSEARRYELAGGDGTDGLVLALDDSAASMASTLQAYAKVYLHTIGASHTRAMVASSPPTYAAIIGRPAPPAKVAIR